MTEANRTTSLDSTFSLSSLARTTACTVWGKRIFSRVCFSCNVPSLKAMVPFCLSRLHSSSMKNGFPPLRLETSKAKLSGMVSISGLVYSICLNSLYAELLSI